MLQCQLNISEIPTFSNWCLEKAIWSCGYLKAPGSLYELLPKDTLDKDFEKAVRGMSGPFHHPTLIDLYENP